MASLTAWEWQINRHAWVASVKGRNTKFQCSRINLKCLKIFSLVEFNNTNFGES